MKVFLASPMGFCAGVDRAIKIVDLVLQRFSQRPIYVRHEIVHNKFVVDGFISRGVRFVESISEVPDGGILIFSAHGVSETIKKEAAQKNLSLILDATCPLVTKIHLEVASISRKGGDCVMIGHDGHVEVEGTLGHFNESGGGKIYLVGKIEDVDTLQVNQPDRLFYVTQTTLSVDETREIIKLLKEKYPKIQGPKKDDICYATQNRQDALRRLSYNCDLVLVVGSSHSSNTRRLVELSQNQKCLTFLISSASDIKEDWIGSDMTIGITAGASTPDILVQEVLQKLSKVAKKRKEEFFHEVAEGGSIEKLNFALPSILRD